MTSTMILGEYGMKLCDVTLLLLSTLGDERQWLNETRNTTQKSTSQKRLEFLVEGLPDGFGGGMSLVCLLQETMVAQLTSHGCQVFPKVFEKLKFSRNFLLLFTFQVAGKFFLCSIESKKREQIC